MDLLGESNFTAFKYKKIKDG